VSTPRLSLRYVTDDLGVLAELAAQGIHEPETMPFSTPWTDVEAPELQRNTLRYYWCSRAETTSQHWDLNMAACDRETVICSAQISAERFPTTRTAETGSWIGRQYQGQGLGREMRRAALHLIFAGFNGEPATTRAWHDDTASLRVTRSLPYTEDGADLAALADHPPQRHPSRRHRARPRVSPHHATWPGQILTVDGNSVGAGNIGEHTRVVFGLGQRSVTEL
jgi:RimJ/RimL family protein N-acetyltransferase